MKVMVSAVVRTPAVSAARAGPMRLITSGIRRVVTPLPSYPSISAGRPFGCRPPGLIMRAARLWPAISGIPSPAAARRTAFPGQRRRALPPRRQAGRGWDNGVMSRLTTLPSGKPGHLAAARCSAR
jgi:hypothetical protein